MTEPAAPPRADASNAVASSVRDVDPTRLQSAFLQSVCARGYVQDVTDLAALDDALAGPPKPAYIGFDATAPSLHIGSLVPIMLLRRLQHSGHKPIILLGGGTTRIGDPSGKDESRQMLDETSIEANINGIRAVFAKYLSFGDGPTDAVMLDNHTWLSQLNYIDFLRDVGRHFTINRMLTFDSVRLRLEREQPLSFIEFNYMLLQAYDFMELHRTQGCVLQMGGSDQWGNIVNGVDLTRRMLGAEVFGLTAPLLTTADGKKMGKTASGAVWLNEDLLSPYEFWQFWRNAADADVTRFLKLFTELPLDEIDALAALEGAAINDAKIRLANEVTALAHGREAAAAAEETARATFVDGAAGAELPTITLTDDDLAEGLTLAQLFVRAGLAGSGKDAKRLIKEGGARMADTAVTDASAKLVRADFAAGDLKLSAGKKRHALVKLAG